MIPREVFEQTLLSFLEPIKSYLDDPNITEIMINGPEQIFYEKKGKIHTSEVTFSTREALESALRNLGQFVGRQVDAHHPILEARLPDGSRVEAILPPAAPDGPHVAIRRFSKEKLDIDKLISFGALGNDSADFLKPL
ncbi:MAG: Flp pilus assembly complex ATPase component TadA [Myxococcales bacterium]|nr:MAG: Flp pilus assembly complex ATPase component TadA [Myxococcales bacterium]